jgi:sugar phosphate isomerase/epimerase
MADYKIENIYQGGYSTFEKPNLLGGAGSLGMTTDPRVANILKDASAKLASGTKNIELTLITPKIVDSIPKQQFKELKRLGKITGVEYSVHGPVIDTTGVSQQGFSELNREASERRIIDTLHKSHELNPKGDIPVVFHSAEGIPGSEWKTLGEDRKAQKLVVISRDTGKMIPIEEEKKFYPGPKKIVEEIMTSEHGLRSMNATEWMNSLEQVEFQRENAERILEDVHPIFQGIYMEILAGKRDSSKLNAEEQEQLNKIYSAGAYTHQADLSIRGLFDKAYKNCKSKKQKEHLSEISEQYGKELGMNEKGDLGIQSLNPKIQSNAMLNLIKGLSQVRPELYVPIEEFAVEQSSKTFGNAALSSYKEFKDESPLVTIENPPAGFGLSTAKDLKDLVEASRKHFVQEAVKDGILSKKAAEKKAEKLIAATWDLGHINMLRAKGFEEKDIIKETEVIAPYVNHVHLSDNFGMEHTELPMGMGNVPMKEMMEKLGQKGFEAKKVIEAADWWQHFQTSPFQESLEALGSNMYSMGAGEGPYWSQAPGLQQGYAGGFGNMLPQTHYGMFGAGFSQLPVELGGSNAGAGGRMSGRGME